MMNMPIETKLHAPSLFDGDVYLGDTVNIQRPGAKVLVATIISIDENWVRVRPHRKVKVKLRNGKTEFRVRLEPPRKMRASNMTIAAVRPAHRTVVKQEPEGEE